MARSLCIVATLLAMIGAAGATLHREGQKANGAKRGRESLCLERRAQP